MCNFEKIKKLLSKQGHIDYWKNTAAKDWKVVNVLFGTKYFVHALFYSHLVLEKLLKAHWVKDNESNHPPKIHNLVYLLSKTKLNLQEDSIAFLEQMNLFQLEGRYPDYRTNINKVYKGKQTQEIIKEVNKVRKWLLKNLQ